MSTEAQADDDRSSLADQEAQCRAFAEKKGRRIDFVWTDAGVSGRDEERLERLVTWCEGHPQRRPAGGLVVVLNASRWGRFVGRPDASGYYRHRLYRAGWAVEFVQQPSTGDRTTDGVLTVLHDSRAAAESEERAYRARSGMMGQARQGRWQGRPPFGYDREAISESGKRRRLAPGERAATGERVQLVPGATEHVQTVRLIFKWAGQGVSRNEIAQRLNEANRPTPRSRYSGGRKRRDGTRGADCWEGFAQVDEILHNPAYFGRLEWRPKTKDAAPAPEPIVHENAHESLVSREVWERAQHALGKKGTRTATPGRYLLSGKLQCVCGASFVGGGGQRRFLKLRPHQVGTHVQVGGSHSSEFRLAKAGEHGTHVPFNDPERYEFYKCPRCRTPRVTINKRWLERSVVALVEQHVRRVVANGSFDEVLDQVIAAERRGRTKTRADWEAERAELKEGHARVLQLVAKGLMREDEIASAVTVFRQRMEVVEQELQRGRFDERRSAVSPKERQELKRMAREFSRRIQRADVATARELLGAWIAEVRIDARKAKRRVGTIVLRNAPVGFAESSSARRGLTGKTFPLPDGIRPRGVA